MGMKDEVVDEESGGHEEPLLLKSSSSNNGGGGGEGSSSSRSSSEIDDGSVKGVVDYRGERIIDRSKYGRWRSASLIVAAEFGETFAYHGLSSNLITYLTGPLRQSTVDAAVNINAWTGVQWMLPLFGAFVADSYLGRFRTILFSSLIYVLGLGVVTLSAVLPAKECHTTNKDNDINSCNSSFRLLFFFFSLYLVALGKAGFKPCAQAFGADQFDGNNPEESKSKSSFFNWWYFSICIGSVFSLLIVIYIQDNFSWGLGYGIPCICMAIALFLFTLGTKTYRYSVKEEKENPLLRIAQVYVVAIKNWRIATPPYIAQEEEAGLSQSFRVGTHQFRFLDKALVEVSGKQGKQCSISQVEDAKAILRLFPVWVTCLMYAVVLSQSWTFFTKQGSTLDRSITPNFQIPPASLQTFIYLSLVLLIPIYDRLFVPFARTFTGKPNGITVLQRLGGGLFVSIISMAVSAIVEKRRLEVVHQYGLVDKPEEIVPMSVWWLVPQYVLIGLTQVFTMIGMQEFFYDQVPDGLRSVGVSIYLSTLGIGSFLSGFLISMIENITGGNGRVGWFSNNLNEGHLDYFYWLLAGLTALDLVAHLYFSRSYLYKRGHLV